MKVNNFWLSEWVQFQRLIIIIISNLVIYSPRWNFNWITVRKEKEFNIKRGLSEKDLKRHVDSLLYA